MRSLFLLVILCFISSVSLGQDSGETLILDTEYIHVFVNKKRKIILDGEKSSLLKLERFLEKTDKTKAKIGTLKPTPIAVFAEFEKVSRLFKKKGIDTDWYRDSDFTTPFFEEEK